jgi:PhzF family phenazine biosynthesis protein
VSNPIYQVDAFSNEPFKGNPAAVCPLESERPAAWMQAVATEMNLSETAFLVPRDDGFGLRWFTPAKEVKLCGHATLASAHVLFETGRVGPGVPARFRTKSGLLTAEREGSAIALDFPVMEMVEDRLPEEVEDALGVKPRFVSRTDPERHDLDYLIEVDSESEVRAVRPDFGRLARAFSAGFIVTARGAGSEYDFVSRFFCPAWGIDEDPVTGSAHCCLASHWGARLGKNEMTGFQASARGGFVGTRLIGDRVRLLGEAVTVLVGKLTA